MPLRFNVSILQAGRSLRSRPIDLEQDDADPDHETPEQAMPSTRGARETRMQKRLKQATIKAESEEAEDEVADDLGTDEDEDLEALHEEAEVSDAPLCPDTLILEPDMRCQTAPGTPLLPVAI